MTNRLNLDFSISSAQERRDFLDKYIEQFNERHPSQPLTQTELETCANYVLWGKDADGKTGVQKKFYQLETRSKTWDRKDCESLDGLMEMPTFNEASLTSLSQPKLRARKEKFSRSQARAQCHPELLPTLENLFHRIDLLDFSIRNWELNHGKNRNLPASLINQLTEEERNHALSQIQSWNQCTYLKKRHLLVELCKEQYTLRDTFIEPIAPVQPEPTTEIAPPEIDQDIPVFPLGTISPNRIAQLLFQDFGVLAPACFSNSDLKQISDFLWARAKKVGRFFDFREPDHVYQLFLQLGQLDEEATQTDNLYSNLRQLLDTLDFYRKQADLDPIQDAIITLKVDKVSNQEIALQINKQFNKTYNANYISTIFKQKAIKRICEAAEMHERICQNLFFQEAFKTCPRCGRSLLLDPDNFVRRTRSKDGFSTQCKKCDKEVRLLKKED